jgi:hypothetical protein
MCWPPAGSLARHARNTSTRAGNRMPPGSGAANAHNASRGPTVAPVAHERPYRGAAPCMMMMHVGSVGHHPQRALT